MFTARSQHFVGRTAAPDAEKVQWVGSRAQLLYDFKMPWIKRLSFLLQNMGKDIFLYRRRGLAMVKRTHTHALAHFGDPCSALSRDTNVCVSVQCNEKVICDNRSLRLGAIYKFNCQLFWAPRRSEDSRKYRVSSMKTGDMCSMPNVLINIPCTNTETYRLNCTLPTV